MADWTSIGSGMQSIVVSDNSVYAVSQQDQCIYAFDGLQWLKIGGPGSLFVGNDSGLYGISPNGTQVWQYDFADDIMQWSQIGGAMKTLIAGGDNLYGVDGSSGNLMLYTGTPGDWQMIGGPGLLFTANHDTIFGISPNGDQIWGNGPNGWVKLGGAASNLIATDDALYAVDSQGNVSYYDPSTGGWPSANGAGIMFAASGFRLACIAPGKQSIWLYDEDSTSWNQIGDAADSIALGTYSAFALQGGNVSVYDFPEDSSLLSSAEPKDAPTTPWIFRFNTSNSMFAGFDGRLTYQYASGTMLTGGVDVSCKKGEQVVQYLDLATTSLPSIGLVTRNEGIFSDSWAVDSLNAFQTESNMLYQFQISGDLPYKDFGSYKVTQEVDLSPGHNPVVVYVWRRQTSNSKYGHASLLLQDTGQYISWWPEGYTWESVMYLGVDARPVSQNRTYAQDEAAEDNLKPEIVIYLDKLDQTAMTNWWSTFSSNPQNLWGLFTNNCATVAFQALKAGGAYQYLTAAQQQRYNAYGTKTSPWTPNIIVEFAQDLAVGQQPQASTQVVR